MRIRRTVAAVALAGGVLATASACKPEAPCLRGHYETELMPIWIGKTMTLIPESDWVCDVYGPAPSA